MQRTFLLAGALAGFIGVGFGAFGAHGLRGRLSPGHAGGVRNGRALSDVPRAGADGDRPPLSDRLNGRLIEAAGWLFVAGIVLFSGSLYLLAVTGVTDARRHHAHRRRRVPGRLGVSRARYALNRRTSIAYFRTL